MNKIKNIKFYKGMLIIVDMVNGFVREGILHDEKIAMVVPRQIELIKEAKNHGNLIVFVKDNHTLSSVEHKRFLDTHCLKGSKEAEIIDELKSYENDGDTISILKNSTSFMESPTFRNVLYNAHSVEEVDVVGCCTDICVFNGSMGLANYYDQWDRNVDIRVHTDAIATFCEEDRQNYVEASKLLMEQQGIKLVKKRK